MISHLLKSAKKKLSAKKIQLIFLIIIVFTVFAFFFVKNNQFHSGLLPNIQSPTSWKYNKNITTPLIGKSTVNSDVTLGNLSKDQVTLSVPKGAFDSDTNITLANPDTVPVIAPTVIETIGAPVEILATTKTRLNDKATITFQFEKGALPQNTQADHLQVAYYDGNTWEYIKPAKVDMATGTMTFNTFHFSLFGPNLLKDDSTLIKSWVHSQALTNQLNNTPEKQSDIVAGQIITLTLEKMGVTDPAAAAKVRENLEKDPNYSRIANTYKNNNEEMAKNIAVIVRTKIAEHVPKELFTNHTLKESGEAPGDVAAVAKAVGYISEGNYKEAAKEIGEQVADKFIIMTAGKIAVEVTKAQIANWKDGEIEAAYQAYKNGADAKFYGYNVDKGDFQGVWLQMRGIRRQLELEAITEENKGREEAGLTPLSDKQEEALRERVKQSFEKQFSLRKDREADLAKEEDKLKQIMNSFEKAGFLGLTPPKGLDKGYDIDNKMDVLNHFAQKMMEDTNRFDISDKTGLLVNGKLSLEDLVQGASLYFGSNNDEDGKKAYAKFLNDRFGILPYPPLSKLTGSWKGSITVTDVYVDPSLKNNKEALKKEGCDYDIDFESLKGKTNPVEFTLNASTETTGTMAFTSGKTAKTINITYSNGTINGSYSEQGGTVTMNLTATSNKDTYSIGGSMLMNFKDKIKIKSSLSAAR